jgi:hypothetical protein
MHEIVAINTQCDQILLAVLAIVTAEFLVMNLKVVSTATVLGISTRLSPRSSHGGLHRMRHPTGPRCVLREFAS